MDNKEAILEYINLIQEKLDSLDKDKIHVLYFSYYFNFYNMWKNPLLIFTKLLNLLNKDKSIDHVAHISRFNQDNGKRVVKIFEATMKLGMEENDLFDKLKSFQGICYIETIDKKVDKVKAKIFENKYYAVPYSKELAALSGIDLKLLDKVLKQPKTNKGFCSWLEALFLIDQGIKINHIEKGNALEITPADLFHGDLGNKRILFAY